MGMTWEEHQRMVEEGHGMHECASDCPLPPRRGFVIGPLVETKWKVGPWLGHPNANPFPPHFHEINPLRQQVHIIWGDAEQTVPVAVQDDDGCQALIIGEAR